MKVGVISDTHGLLRREVFERFADVEHILHAGDVGPAELLTELEAIAPVTAVWGNTDGFDIRARVPEVAEVTLGGVRIVVVHGMQVGSPTVEKMAAAYPDAGMVVFGHSHVPVIRTVGSVLAVNPGSAGPIRFRGKPTLAIATLEDGRARVELVELRNER
ncbi:MAG TPA: metallophosphoesterase family protein [Longimicrobiaceae bacterium]|jgi:putative phosphoesterase|nr:metallophosphoesterase family protein [Longimicrobiaceae bacterium]